MRKKDLRKKLNGYQRADRARFNMFTNPKFLLTPAEFLLYEFYIAITDWDVDHKNTYNTFDTTDLEVALLLGYKSASTISLLRNRLINKKLVKPLPDGSHRVAGFEKWRLRKKEDDFLVNKNVNIHKIDENINENQDQNGVYSLVSSKDQFNRELDEPITDEELDRIFGVLEERGKNGDGN